jgi:hypothetical protein
MRELSSTSSSLKSVAGVQQVPAFQDEYSCTDPLMVASTNPMSFMNSLIQVLLINSFAFVVRLWKARSNGSGVPFE